MAKVGFLGLGRMGFPMARNLATAGHDVHVYDPSEEVGRKAAKAGLKTASRVDVAVEGADFVITMVPTGRHVLEIFLGDDGVLAKMAKGSMAIDSSTIDTADARRLHAAGRERGIAVLDAPVSGGVMGAANAGTLTFMVGGSDAAFAKAEPILAAMGKAVIHAGGAGAGQAAKICNNMILGATMIATCEGFALADKLGLDLQTFFDISSKASGQSWSMTAYCPVPGVGPQSPADNGYQGGFAAGLMLKDLKLAMEAAQAAGAKVPMGQRAEELYEAFANAGNAGVDFSGIIKTL